MRIIEKKGYNTMLLFILIMFALTNISYANKSTIADKVVAKVGNETITYGILEKAFQKNMNRKSATIKNVPKDSVMDFLNLYINYRLKVLDAIDRSFDKDSAVNADIEQNRKILAESYFYEKKLMNPWLERMLQFRKKEYRIAVIVFAMAPAPNRDTLAAYNKAMSCLNLIKSGIPFEIIAADSSEDEATKKYGGEVKSWITAGNVQRPIEDIILKLKPGKYYPELIKTRYGYFLVKLLEEQERVFVKASHILIHKDSEDSTVADRVADEVLEKIKKGVKFSDLAKDYSSDNSSSEKGGELDGYYSRSTGYKDSHKKLVPTFEEALFKLKDQEISGKVNSLYGIHIIRRDSTQGLDFDVEERELKKIYKRSYYDKDKKDFLDSLHKLYKFKIEQSTINELLSYLDTNKTNLDKEWAKNIPTEFYSKELFSILNQTTSIGEFIKLVSSRTELRGLGLNELGISKTIDKIISPFVFNEATKYLEEEYPDFSSLMKEFRDGILLFRVEQLEVWDKLKFDSVLAREYWLSNRTKYQTKPLFDISEIYVLSDSAAQDIYKQISDGTDFDKLAESHTQRQGYREKKGNWGVVDTENNKLAKLLKDNNIKEGEVLEPQKYEKGFSIIKFNRTIPIREKTFEEAISDFAPEFQDIQQRKLTKNWLDSVRKNIRTEINQAVIDELFE